MNLSPAFCSAIPIRSGCGRRIRAYHRYNCALSESNAQIENSSELPTSDTSFSTWAIENKVNMASLELTTYPPKSTFNDQSVPGRGMSVIKAVKNGEPLITMDQNVTLQVTSLEARKNVRPVGISKETWEQLPWYARLALLIVDAKLDANNKWHPWVLRLPASFDTPFHWSGSELRELQNPRIVDAVAEQKKLYRKHFDDINSSPDNTLIRKMSYSTFVWAIECVRSRAFAGPLEVAPFKERFRVFLFLVANTLLWPALHLIPWENALNGGLTAIFTLTSYDLILPRILSVVQGVELRRYAMTPGIDFLNHNSAVTGKAEVAYEYFSNTFVVRAGEDYEVGDQAFISYGAQSNDAFLQYYGFIETDNPADTYTFDSSVERLLGVQKGRLIARRTGFDKATVNTVAKQLKNKREAARTTLQKLCQAELDNMESTFEQDKQLLNKAGTGENARLELAIRYRMQKKTLLQEAYDCI